MRDREVVVLFHELVRVAAGGHIDDEHGLVPELADGAPGNRHQVHVPFLPGRYLQPVPVDHLDRIQVDFGRGADALAEGQDAEEGGEGQGDGDVGRDGLQDGEDGAQQDAQEVFRIGEDGDDEILAAFRPHDFGLAGCVFPDPLELEREEDPEQGEDRDDRE